MVQFKGRTVEHIDYEERKLEALLQQDFALIAARVDLRECSISLFALGPALRHSNISGHDKVRIHLGTERKPHKAKDGWLFTQTGEPFLCWTSAQLENPDFRKKAHDILKKWLEFDSLNRRLSRLGKQIQIGWKTNEMPVERGHASHLTPAKEKQMLEEVIPSIQLLRMVSRDNVELFQPMQQITNWMREKGVDPDPGNLHMLMSAKILTDRRVSEAMAKHPNADAAVGIFLEYAGSDGCVFWQHDSNGVGRKISGTIEELKGKGYTFEFDENGAPTSFDLGIEWLKHGHFEKVAEEGNVFVLRRLKPALEVAENIE